MKVKIRFLTVLMAVLLCGSACTETVSPESNADVDTSSEAPLIEEVVPEETYLPDNLPDNLDYQGKDVNIAYYKYYCTQELVAELKGDVVEDSVYTRNINVMDRLNITLNMVDSGTEWGTIASFVPKLAAAGDSTYDIVDAFQYPISSVILHNSLANLYGSEYLDIEQPWWATDYIDELHLGDGMIKAVAGDANLNMTKNMSCMFINKTVLNDHAGALKLDIEELYQLILDQKWTLDTMYTLAHSVYEDTNGNGVCDNEDVFGCGTITSNLSWHTFIDAGGRFTKYDEEGTPVYCVEDEKNINIMEKLTTMHNDPNFYYAEPSTEGLGELVTMLSKDQLLFKVGFFSDFEKLRDMESEYGILPCPKYDESQEKYLSLIHDQASMFIVPSSCEDVEFSCLVLEAIASESYRTVTPAFYETALKNKYVRDSVSAQIVDIIHQGATSDVAFIYSATCKNLMDTLVSTVLLSGSNIYASQWAKIRRQAENGLSQLLNNYSKVNTNP